MSFDDREKDLEKENSSHYPLDNEIKELWRGKDFLIEMWTSVIPNDADDEECYPILLTYGNISIGLTINEFAELRQAVNNAYEVTQHFGNSGKIEE